MKRIALALGTVAMGLSSTLCAQAPSAERVGGAVPPPPPVPVAVPPVTRATSHGYSLYGGPEESRSQYPERRGIKSEQLGPLVPLPGVPDEITLEDQAREVRRNAAVEFGMYRNQFTGSTQFWMDHDRTRLAKARYAMDETMFRSIHPDYDWGDGGYMYNTATSVGGPQFAGSSNRVIVTPPQGEPTVRHTFNTASAPVNPPRNVRPAASPNPAAPKHGPLVASDRGE
jgi:hypothetical protein